MVNSIHVEEFEQRVKRVQQKMLEEKLDIVITFGNEAEPQYVRYFSDYWPSFETAGVFIPHKGDPAVLIGPEILREPHVLFLRAIWMMSSSSSGVIRFLPGFRFPLPSYFLATRYRCHFSIVSGENIQQASSNTFLPKRFPNRDNLIF